MQCPFCGTDSIPLPPRGEIARCTECGREFRELHDYGFFTYSAELYVPVEKP